MPRNTRDQMDGRIAPAGLAGWLSYWLRDPVLGGASLAAYQALRGFSTETCSNIGARRGMGLHRFTGRYRLPDDDRAARANWARLKPEAVSPPEMDAAMTRLWASICRTLAELSALERLWPEGRIAVTGAEHVTAAWESGRPLLIAGLHLGNWEAIAPALIGLGIPATTVQQPPANRFEHRLVAAARRRAGVKAILPGFGAAYAVRQTLAERRAAVVIYADEFIDGRVHGPALGRPLQATGNIAHIPRLAASSGAVVIPAHCRREDGARFTVHFGPPVALAGAGGEAGLMADIAALNAVIAPVVLANLDQWLMLPDFRFDR